jgi:hypothetical protein
VLRLLRELVDFVARDVVKEMADLISAVTDDGRPARR